MSAEVRLRRLQQLVLDPGFLGLEPLLDLLLGVHQELGASDLAQDKYVADFLEWGECPPACRSFSHPHPHPYPRSCLGLGVGQREEVSLGWLVGAGWTWGEPPIQEPRIWGDVRLPLCLTGQGRVGSAEARVAMTQNQDLGAMVSWAGRCLLWTPCTPSPSLGLGTCWGALSPRELPPHHQNGLCGPPPCQSAGGAGGTEQGSCQGHGRWAGVRRQPLQLSQQVPRP